jgi:hypothetical protein
MLSVFHSNYKSQVNLHTECILRYCERPRNTVYIKDKFDAVVSDYFSTIVADFKELVSASPETLFNIRELFDGLTNDEKSDINDRLNLKGLYDRFIKKEDAFLQSDEKSIYNSDYLISKVNFGTCPYCNEMNLHSFFSLKHNGERRNFDWDHIIHKDDYPFLAISFYNLVPSCKVCNFLKKNETIDLSPYEKFEVDELYKFYVSGQSTDFLKEIDSIELFLIVSQSEQGKKIGDIIDITCMDKRYAAQKVFISNLLNKKRIYQSPLWESISNLITQEISLEQSDIDMLLFTQYSSSLDYFKSPYSKLTSDILKGIRLNP